MKKRWLNVAVLFFAAFVLWTAAVQIIDVQAIGPQGTTVGFAALNQMVHNFAGVHMDLYVLTDWMGLVPIATAAVFALLGLVQWIKRKNILKVDSDTLVLGGFYILVIASYLFFECFVINYRPILIEGILEASYPSSTTLLVLSVMPAALLQVKTRIKTQTLQTVTLIAIRCYVIFMVLGRLVSGVHWATDIIGGALLSISFVSLYRFASDLLKQK